MCFVSLFFNLCESAVGPKRVGLGKENSGARRGEKEQGAAGIWIGCQRLKAN